MRNAKQVKSSETHNEGLHAKGGKARADNDPLFKAERARDGKFLSMPDRFTGGRFPEGYPVEAVSQEDFLKQGGHPDYAPAGGASKSLSTAAVKPKQ